MYIHVYVCVCVCLSGFRKCELFTMQESPKAWIYLNLNQKCPFQFDAWIGAIYTLSNLNGIAMFSISRYAIQCVVNEMLFRMFVNLRECCCFLYIYFSTSTEGTGTVI